MRMRQLSDQTSQKKRGKRFARGVWIGLIILCLSLAAGCSGETPQPDPNPSAVSAAEQEETPAKSGSAKQEETAEPEESEKPEEAAEPEKTEKPEGSAEAKEPEKPKGSTEPKQPEEFSLKDIPEYSGTPFVAVNGNAPYFTEGDMTTDSFEKYSRLDSLGRCQTAYACVGEDLMPTEKRGSIGQVKPSGWHTVKYDFVDGKYLYNRCHLIGYQLTAENANERNLITGTRYMNVDGMLPFENMVADYVHETGNHVLYRVTPVYEEDNLLASGVLMEAESVEDEGEGVLYNVFVYNVQPNVSIDYATGESRISVKESAPEKKETSDTKKESTKTEEKKASGKKNEQTETEKKKEPEKESVNYILNANTKKFHLPECSSVRQMNESNKIEFTGSRDEAIEQGYDPCGRCHP